MKALYTKENIELVNELNNGFMAVAVAKNKDTVIDYSKYPTHSALLERYYNGESVMALFFEAVTGRTASEDQTKQGVALSTSLYSASAQSILSDCDLNDYPDQFHGYITRYVKRMTPYSTLLVIEFMLTLSK